MCFSFQNLLFWRCESFWYKLWLLGQGTGPSQRVIATKETSLSRVQTRDLCVLSAQDRPHDNSGLSLIQSPELNLKFKSADIEVRTRCHFHFFLKVKACVLTIKTRFPLSLSQRDDGNSHRRALGCFPCFSVYFHYVTTVLLVFG
jgi:hypothetical protein